MVPFFLKEEENLRDEIVCKSLIACINTDEQLIWSIRIDKSENTWKFTRYTRETR